MIVVLNVFMISIYLLLTIFHCTWHGPADMCLWFSARVCSHNEFRKWLLWVNVLTILEDAEVNQRVIGPEGRGLYRKWIEAAIPHYWQRSILWCPFWEHSPSIVEFCFMIVWGHLFAIANNTWMQLKGGSFKLTLPPLTLTWDICCQDISLSRVSSASSWCKNRLETECVEGKFIERDFVSTGAVLESLLHPPFPKTRRQALMNRIVVEYDSKKTLQAFVTSHSAVDSHEAETL